MIPRQRQVRLRHALAPYLAHGRRRLAALSGLSVCSGLAQSAVLYLLVQVGLGIASGKPASPATLSVAKLSLPVPRAIMAAGAFALVMLVAEVAAARISARMSSSAQTNARNHLLRSFLSASWDLQSQERQGHLQELLSTHVDRVANGVALMANGTVAGLNFAALVAVALLVQPLGTIVIVAGAAGLFLVLRPLAAKTHASAAVQTEANAEYAVQVSEVVRLAQEIRVFDAAERVFERAVRAAARAEASLVRTRFLLRALPSVYQASALFLVLTALGGMYAARTTAIGALGAVVLLLVRSLSYSQQLQAVYQQSAEVSSYLADFAEWESRYATATVKEGLAPIDDVREIRFRDVAFSYGRDDPVLSGLSFDVERGECIGIVGPSGAGKSTLVQLLLRLREPTGGIYQINGADASSYRLSDFHRTAAFVPQEPRLVRGTVAENIRFFRPWIETDAVVAAARMANLSDEIDAAAGGYEREIGEGAAGLSGGQKQRLVIARALAGSPSVLILDEPTSALDGESEHLLRTALASLRGAFTLFIVAHRLSTLEFCDRIMVIERGEITAFAPARELAETSTHFREALRHHAAS